MIKMEIIHIADGRYDEYEKLLLERDRCKKEANILMSEYIRVFGEKITAIFKLKIACIEKKKTLSYYLVYLNRGESVDANKVQELIKLEMVEYQKHLNDMIKQNELCKSMERIPESEALKIKQIYRSIAKKLHPDINPITNQDEQLLELWQRNVTAYQCNDLKELEEIEVLVDMALAAHGQNKITQYIPDISTKIEELKNEIEKIKSTDPYQYKYLLNDIHLVREKNTELSNELKEYEDYLAYLDEQLKQFFEKGGTITWNNETS